MVSASCIRALSLDVVMELVPTERISEGQYPSGFYKLNGFLVGDDINRSILNMRFLQIGIAVAMFSVALSTAREKGSRILFGLFVGSVPIGLWVIPSTQPASWSIIGLISLCIYQVGVAHKNNKFNYLIVVIGTCVSLTLALQSRRDSILNLFLILFLVLISRYKAVFIRQNRRILIFAVVPVFALSLSLVHLRFRSLSSFFPLSKLFDPVLFEGVTNIVPKVIVGLIGGSDQLGAPDFAPPLLVLLLMTIGVGTYLSTLWSAISREARISAVVGGFLLFLLPLRFLLESSGPVSRYVYVIYLSCLIVIAAGLETDTFVAPKRPDLLNKTILFSVSLAQSFALHHTLRRYLTGTNVKRFNLNYGAEWWWSHGLSPMSVWVIGSISFATAMSLTRQLAKVQRQ